MSQKTTVLFIWQPRQELKEYIKKGLKDLPITFLFPPDANAYTELAPQADIIVGWRPTKSLLYRAEKLSLFINPGAGVQHLIDLFKEVTQKGVTLCNGHGNSYFTAQHAVALLLALTNKVIPHHNWMVQGEWRKGDNDAVSIPLRERTIGLLGYGHVNKKVHTFLSGFNVSFAVIRRDWTQPLLLPAKKFNHSEVHQFLKEVDTVIISVPLTGETKGMIATKELALLGPTSLVVNMGRGPVIDECSLYTALKEKTIAGAAIDVWYNYTPDPDDHGRKYPFSYPFHQLDNVILSPHRAASPLHDLQRWDEVIENIRRFATGEQKFLNTVDLDREY